MKNKIKAAGGIVIQGKKILFIKKNGRWEFPKGRLKKGSKRKNTALREIYEETGIPQENLNIIKPLIPTHDNIKDGKDVIIKKTYWYLVELNQIPICLLYNHIFSIFNVIMRWY